MGDGGKEQVVVALTKPERCYCMKRRGMLRNSDHTSMVSGSWCSLIIVTSPEEQVAQWLEILAKLDFEVELRLGRRTMIYIIYSKFSYYLFKQIF
ncbi:hypothetical protein T4D_6216 [Trichinella pseudospiralis]|uniref:Uncharacterized protein n=1 Tax=Trichinella pseudospiralis TaxID=6337 RepID=A0A0V1FF93_TRIPS|nr:hypothetical protein T4D_6216 [Trichinella pseudospiralis]